MTTTSDTFTDHPYTRCKGAGFDGRASNGQAETDCSGLLAFVGIDPPENVETKTGYRFHRSGIWILGGSYNGYIPSHSTGQDSEWFRESDARTALQRGLNSMMSVIPESADEAACVAKLRAPMEAELSTPIRETEDDEQFADRVRRTQKNLQAFARVFAGTSTLNEIRSFLSGEYTELDARYRDWEDYDNDTPFSYFCRRAFARGVVKALARFQAAYDNAQGAEAYREAQERTEAAQRARQDVLERRFAPLLQSCAELGRGAATKCDELPGLSADERRDCRAQCENAIAAKLEADAAQEAAAQAEARRSAAEAKTAAEQRERGMGECVRSCRAQGRDGSTCARVCKAK